MTIQECTAQLNLVHRKWIQLTFPQLLCEKGTKVTEKRGDPNWLAFEIEAVLWMYGALSSKDEVSKEKYIYCF